MVTLSVELCATSLWGDLLYFEGEEVPEFPVKGLDLISLGYVEGKVLGETMNKLEKLWLDSNLTMNKEQLLKNA